MQRGFRAEGGPVALRERRIPPGVPGVIVVPPFIPDPGLPEGTLG